MADKQEFLSKHRFSIAFENSSSPGYVTEKIIQAFAAGNIPIYWGDSEIEKEFNEEAFINCHKFRSFKEVVKRVEYLDKHPEEQWKMITAPIYNRHEVESEAVLKKFLFNICKQSPKKAYRRNRRFWGKEYEKKLRLSYLGYQGHFLKSFFRVISKKLRIYNMTLK